MKIKKLLLVLLAVLLVFSLFGCGKKEPVEDVDPQDTTEPDLDTETDKNTVDIDGKQYDISGTANSNVPKKTEVLLTTEELHALFKKEYDSFKWAKENLGEYYKTDYLKLPAREIGTQTDANVYADIEAEVAKPEYSGKILPDDGFEQYVAWREALESQGASSENNQSGNTSGNTGNTGNTGNNGGQTQQKPSTGNGSSGNSGGSSGNSNGSSGNNGGYSDNVYDGATVIREIKDNMTGGELQEKTYEKPSYDIVG